MRHIERKDFHSLLEGGRRPVGTILQIPSEELVEILGYAGMDYIVLDMEHILIEIGLSCKHADVKFVEMCGKLLESSKAHGSGHAGYKHFLFLHIFAPFGIFRIACL